MQVLTVSNNNVTAELSIANGKTVKIEDVTSSDLQQIMDLIYENPTEYSFIDDEAFKQIKNIANSEVALQINKKLREFKEQVPTLKQSIDSEFTI